MLCQWFQYDMKASRPSRPTTMYDALGYQGMPSAGVCVFRVRRCGCASSRAIRLSTGSIRASIHGDDLGDRAGCAVGEQQFHHDGLHPGRAALRRSAHKDVVSAEERSAATVDCRTRGADIHARHPAPPRLVPQQGLPLGERLSRTANGTPGSASQCGICEGAGLVKWCSGARGQGRGLVEVRRACCWRFRTRVSCCVVARLPGICPRRSGLHGAVGPRPARTQSVSRRRHGVGVMPIPSSLGVVSELHATARCWRQRISPSRRP